MSIPQNHHTPEYIRAILDEAYLTRVHDLPRSFELVRDGLSLSREIDNAELIAKSLTYLSLFHMIVAEFSISEKFSLEAIDYYQKLGDEKGIADARYNLAGIYYKTDNYHLGLVVLHECLETYRKFEDYASCSKVEKSLGTIYEYFGDRTNAMRSYELAIESAKNARDLNLESNGYNPLSGMLLKDGRVDEAMDLIQKAIALKKQTGDERGIAFSIYGRGKVYSAMGEYRLAEMDFKEALRIHIAKNERLGTGMTYNKMGKLYTLTGEYALAKEFLLKGMRFCEQYGINLFQSKCCYQLAEVSRLEGNFQDAFSYLSKYQHEREAILRAQTERVIDNYEAIHRMKALEFEARAQKEKAEIIEKKNRAEEAARIKSEFLSTMSHEIRTPLNGIISIAGMLKGDSDPNERRMIDSLKYSGEHLMRIVNDILDFTKLESGKLQIEEQDFDLGNFLGTTLEAYLPLARSKAITLLLKNSVSSSKTYLADTTRLNQVLGNLISNAIKFTDEGGIELSAEVLVPEDGGDKIRFAVTDSGIGIEENHLEQIFESFAQSRSVLTRKHGGTGLGLAIVKKILSLMGSEIRVESKPGHGSKFYFDVYLAHGQPEIKKPEVHSHAMAYQKVLLAEDNPINAMVAKKILSDFGLEVFHAENGSEAVKAAEKEKYDIIFMDIHMPEMSGYEAVDRIRSGHGPNRDCIIYALTADISADQDHGYTDNFQGILLKPIEFDKLRRVLSGV